jgi:hypothetical protein
MSSLTYQEKVLYGEFAAVIAAIVFYIHFIRVAPPGTYSIHAILLFVAMLLFLYRSFYHRRSGDIVTDERDAMISGLGAQWGNLILAVGVASILVMFWEHGRPESVQRMVDRLFFLLMLSIGARIVRQLVAYRMAA